MKHLIFATVLVTASYCKGSTIEFGGTILSDAKNVDGNTGATWNYGANFGGDVSTNPTEHGGFYDDGHGTWNLYGVGMFGGWAVADTAYSTYDGQTNALTGMNSNIALCPGTAGALCSGRRRHFLRNYGHHHRAVMAYNAADVEEKKTLRVSLKASQQKLQKEYDSFKQFLKPDVNLRGKNPKGLQMSNGFEYSPENKAKVIEVLHVFKNYPEFQKRLWRCKEWPEHKSLCIKLEKNFFDQVHKIVNVSQDEEKYQVELERGVELYMKIDYTVLGMSPG